MSPSLNSLSSTFSANASKTKAFTAPSTIIEQRMPDTPGAAISVAPPSLPMTMRNLRQQTLSTRCSATKACHAGLGATPLAQVSSIKIRRFAGQDGWLFFQSVRFAQTSGRSRSAA